MKKMKNINYKSLLLILLFVVIIIFGILSYNGLLFFTSGFNNFDFLLFNIIGDALLVGIVTHISSKNISLSISKKEFDRNNKINVTINKSRNEIINYETFMNIYKNNDIYFAMSESDRKIIDYIYKLYDCFLNTLMCEGVEKQLLDTLLNIPFFFKYYEDENIEDSYEEIIKKFDPNKRFNNISILKELLTKEDIKKLSRFSNIILNCKHYVITNLNNVEGCQLLATSDNIVACKIPCLPNHTYDIFMYYTSDHWIDFMAFSFDYDSKEYVTNLSGFKYTNNEENMKPAKINLKDFIIVK